MSTKTPDIPTHPPRCLQQLLFLPPISVLRCVNETAGDTKSFQALQRPLTFLYGLEKGVSILARFERVAT